MKGFVFSLLVAGVCFTSAAHAVCNIQRDAFGVVVGCCADVGGGTPMAEDTVCINPLNPCQKSKCTAPVNANTAGSCNKVAFSNTTGHPACLKDGDLCSVGECYQQACTYIGNNPANGFDALCDDNEDCTSDSCDDDGASFVDPPTCTNTAVGNGTSCDSNPGGECQVGICAAGDCVNSPAPDYTDCSGTSSEGDCQPRHCVAGVCTNNGDPIPCEGELAICRKWKCEWLTTTTYECTPVKAVGDDCDTNPWDCKNQVCNSQGKCGNQAAQAQSFCDPDRIDDGSNPNVVLPNCAAGRCDARKECEANGYDDTYNGMNCNDGNVCTTGSTCVENANGVGGVCKATSATQCEASTVDCPVCNVGNCNPAAGAPNCGCP